MGPILLLSTYLLPVDEIIRSLHIWWQDCSSRSFAGAVSHWTYLMLVVVHFEQFLLLWCQLWLVCSRLRTWIHNCKTHASRDEDVLSTATTGVIWRNNGCLIDIIVIMGLLFMHSCCLVLVIVVRNVSTWVADGSFLIMTVELLNIQASSTVMIT